MNCSKCNREVFFKDKNLCHECAIIEALQNQNERLKSQNQTLEKEMALLKKVFEAIKDKRVSQKECMKLGRNMVLNTYLWDEIIDKTLEKYEESRKVDN
jgi:hypothetical protein